MLSYNLKLQRMIRHSLLLLAFGSIVTATAAHASPLVLNFSSDFTYFTTLNGVALNDHTPFSFQATFDSAGDLDTAAGFGVFNAAITFHLLGNSYTVDPNADVKVLLLDPVSGFQYGAGLTDSNFYFDMGADIFTGVTPAFSADSPSPTVLTSPNDGFASAFTIPFVGGGSLVLLNENAFYSSSSSAEITSVPEPATLGLCLLALGWVARRSRRPIDS
jgi:hypothetical protein